MPKASDKKLRAHSLSVSSRLLYLSPSSLFLSLSLTPSTLATVPTTVHPLLLDQTLALRPRASTLVSPPPASVKNVAAKQRGGITKRRCSIFIPPAFDDKVRRKEGKSFCRDGKERRRGEGEKMKSAANLRRFRSGRRRWLARSLSESGIHRRTLSRGLEGTYARFEIHIPRGSRE